MAADLTGRGAVVTGASRGLGREIAVALARAGAEVALASRDRAGLETTAARAREESGRGAHVICADVTSPGDVQRLRAETESSLGTAAILVNAAGVFGPLAPFAEADPADWIETLTVNTIGPYLTCRAFVPGMIAAGFGRIVNVSSAASLYAPGALDSAYSTSKAALNRMTRHLAAELAGTGVTAAVIHPGSVKTEMWADIRDQAAALGESAGVFRGWVDRVDRSGGDPPSKGAELVLELVDPDSDGGNGGFHWPREGIDRPVPSW